MAEKSRPLPVLVLDEAAVELGGGAPMGVSASAAFGGCPG
jgi:hypothetical protein